MPRTDVYNTEGRKVGTAILPPEIFGLKINPDLVHQAAIAQMANMRQVLAHVKDRGEVRGGGRKPWRQKGTGRARHGSIRSPIWKGGGVTFGPTKERVFKKRINKKMKRKAMFMTLSSKVKDKELIVLDKLELKEAKTKQMLEILNNLFKKKKKSILVVIPKSDIKIIRANRNIPYAKTLRADNLNVLDLLSFKYLLMPKEAINIIKDTYLKPKTKDNKSKTQSSNVKSNPKSK